MQHLAATTLLCLLASGAVWAQAGPEVRTLPAFHAVEVSNGIELHLAPGTIQHVEARADIPEQLERIKTEVREGVLNITFEREITETWGSRHTRHLVVNVTATSLTALTASGGARVDVEGAFNSPNLAVVVSSGATLKASFPNTALVARVSSGGVVTVAGGGPRLDVSATSGGVFKGDNFSVQDCAATAGSGGTVNVAVQHELFATAGSGGDIRYSGSPKDVTRRISSGGSVNGR